MSTDPEDPTVPKDPTRGPVQVVALAPPEAATKSKLLVRIEKLADINPDPEVVARTWLLLNSPEMFTEFISKTFGVDGSRFAAQMGRMAEQYVSAHTDGAPIMDDDDHDFEVVVCGSFTIENAGAPISIDRVEGYPNQDTDQGDLSFDVIRRILVVALEGVKAAQKEQDAARDAEKDAARDAEKDASKESTAEDDIN